MLVYGVPGPQLLYILISYVFIFVVKLKINLIVFQFISLFSGRSVFKLDEDK